MVPYRRLSSSQKWTSFFSSYLKHPSVGINLSLFTTAGSRQHHRQATQRMAIDMAARTIYLPDIIGIDDFTGFAFRVNPAIIYQYHSVTVLCRKIQVMQGNDNR